MPEVKKPEGLKFILDVGDVIRLTTGQNALVLGYGIYDEQYFCVKHYADGVRFASACYMCSPENSGAYRPDIVGIEDDVEKILRVLRDYIKADADLTEKVAARQRRTPEP